MQTEAIPKPGSSFAKWIRSQQTAWLLFSALIPIIIVLGLNIISALFFSTSYAEFTVNNIGIIEGPYGFPVIAGTMTNSGTKTADVTILGKCFANDIPVFFGKSLYDMSLWFFTGKPKDLLEFENTLKPGESGSFLFQLNDPEAKNTPLPRKYVRFEIPSNKINFTGKYNCDRAELIVFGETSAYQKEDQKAAPFIFGSLVILILLMGLRFNHPPVWFRWRHNLFTFVFSIILLVVNYQVEISRLTPYPNEISEPLLMLLIVYGFIGVGAIIFSGIVGWLHSLVLKKMKKINSD